MSNPGYVYFLNAEGTNRYKIGLTNNVDRRLKELNGKQAAFRVNCLWYIAAADMDATEKWLHDRFASRRVHGEWFQFHSDELDTVKSAYAQAKEQFSPRPQVSQTRYDDDHGDLSWGWIAGGIVFFIAVIGSLAGGGQRSAIVQGLTNIRETPNGKIICTVPSGKRITVSESNNPQWLNTSDACDRGSGVIFKNRVREER